MAVWRFSIAGEEVRYGTRERRRLTTAGCNEPFRGRFWCPERQWFRREVCPFVNARECENFKAMCGCI